MYKGIQIPCILLVYMCAHTCMHALSLKNDIQTKNDQRKVSKVINRLKNITDGENVREVNTFCQKMIWGVGQEMKTLPKYLYTEHKHRVKSGPQRLIAPTEVKCLHLEPCTCI